MTVKVIKKNIPIYRVSCQSCNALLEFEEYDKVGFGYSRFVTCPKCGKEVYLLPNLKPHGYVTRE